MTTSNRYHLITGTTNDGWFEDFREAAELGKRVVDMSSSVFAVVVDSKGRNIFSYATRDHKSHQRTYGLGPAQLQDQKGVWHHWDSDRGAELAASGAPVAPFGS